MDKEWPFIFPAPSEKIAKNDLHFQISHVKEELQEFEDEIDKGDMEKAREELVDFVHSVEWLLRFFKKETGLEPSDLMKEVLEKNRARGYYLE